MRITKATSIKKIPNVCLFVSWELVEIFCGEISGKPCGISDGNSDKFPKGNVEEIAKKNV